MKATLTYEGKTVEVEIAEEEARKIFAEPKKTGWERAGIGEYYQYIHISKDTEDGTRAEDDRYQEGRYISSYDLAFDQIRAIKLWLCIKRWAAEHCEPVDWENDIAYKSGIFYNYTTGEISASIVYSSRNAFGVYFDSLEHAEQCIEEFRDELLWYFTECRDRMDG